MNLRSSGGTKRNLVAMAAGVAAAEVASIIYYILTPWFLSPGNRGLYASIGFNILLFVLIHRLAEKHWPLRTWQEAVKMSVWMTLVYVSIYAPFVISVWNPLTYTSLIGPAAHTLLQLSAMTVLICYFKNER